MVVLAQQRLSLQLKPALMHFSCSSSGPSTYLAQHTGTAETWPRRRNQSNISAGGDWGEVSDQTSSTSNPLAGTPAHTVGCLSRAAPSKALPLCKHSGEVSSTR